MHINFEISVKDITILLQIIRVVVTALSYPQSQRYRRCLIWCVVDYDKHFIHRGNNIGRRSVCPVIGFL